MENPFRIKPIDKKGVDEALSLVKATNYVVTYIDPSNDPDVGQYPTFADGAETAIENFRQVNSTARVLAVNPESKGVTA